MRFHLKSFQEDGIMYYQLYMSCPACLAIGRDNRPCSFWKHHDDGCLGDIYVGNNAYYKCRRCGRSVHVKNWKCSCPEHSGSLDFFMGESCHSVVNPTAIGRSLPSMVETTGIQWIQSFISNMEESRRA